MWLLQIHVIYFLCSIISTWRILDIVLWNEDTIIRDRLHMLTTSAIQVDAQISSVEQREGYYTWSSAHS
jgi:hypothetical protein